jgi:hypothetical protein
MGCYGVDWYGWGLELVEGSCEQGNEPSVSIKYCEILEWLSDYRLLKKASIPWKANMPERTRENHENRETEYLVSQPRFEPNTTPKQVDSFSITPSCYALHVLCLSAASPLTTRLRDARYFISRLTNLYWPRLTSPYRPTVNIFVLNNDMM